MSGSDPAFIIWEEFMFSFYSVDNNYIQYLKQYDAQIPSVVYENNNKFVCGALLNIKGYDYYAPISHFSKKQRTNFPIKQKGQIISSVRLCFMFPVPKNTNVLCRLNFNLIAHADLNYANLLRYEYSYCLKNMNDLIKQTNKVYNIGINKNHVLNYTCCDFYKLESICDNYDPSINYSVCTQTTQN